MEATSERPKFTRITGVGEVSGLIKIKRLGRIRLGIKKQKEGTDVTFPSETEHFVCPPEVAKVYGEAPQQLDGMFLSNNPEEVYTEKLALYGSGKQLKCHGNGQTAERYDEQKNTWGPRTCPCEHFKSDENPKGQCRPQGDLMVMLPKVNPWGVYQITTRSIYARAGILSSLKQLAETMKGATGQDRIAGIPIVLTRVPQETNHKGKRRTHFILTFTPALTFEQLLDLRKSPDLMVLPAQYRNALIEGPVDENPKADPPDVIVGHDEDDDDEDPTDVIDGNGQVDAAALAGMSDEDMAKVQERLNQGKAPAKQEPSAKPAPPAKTEAPAPKTELRFNEVLLAIKDDETLTAIKGEVEKGMGVVGKSHKLTVPGQKEFLRRFRIEADKRGLARLPF